MPIVSVPTFSDSSLDWRRRPRRLRPAPGEAELGSPTTSMKCPKCGYLGFEHVERCRNCGYDFSLSPPLNLPDLPIRRDEPEDGQPLGDLALSDAGPFTLPEPARSP